MSEKQEKWSLSQAVERIYGIIEVKEAKSIRQIAKEAGISWKRAKDWVNLILDIQKRPRLRVVPTSDGARYKREPSSGRPPKEESE